ncbi:hypothetical protein JCM19235_6486 [Vibrio maritimus]|uniref:Uncharacterized protein n=1 Tax=Vibrio maritimus TaxID=990268 RepID=A0A090RTR5_9VIBR|nr:hypothetical protein JCM19235_6486 [Vibrio maritimus]
MLRKDLLELFAKQPVDRRSSCFAKSNFLRVLLKASHHFLDDVTQFQSRRLYVLELNENHE